MGALVVIETASEEVVKLVVVGEVTPVARMLPAPPLKICEKVYEPVRQGNFCDVGEIAKAKVKVPEADVEKVELQLPAVIV